jgi:hypothetical protein
MMTVTVSRGVKPVPVTSWADASRAVRAYIEERGVGSAEWYRTVPWGGAAIRVGGRVVAHVSYNGRIWDRNRKELTP